ncbi:MAG TPA: molybdopterin-dependent oxidoreductase [Dehalococcoidales bacterium]|nr:molybdopterin-dependent oxidoreductase [Dehalococcoidales bacterium]
MSGTEEHVVRTACPAHCAANACGILAHVADGRVVKLEPADFPDRRLRRICLRGLSSLQMLYHPDRLKYPLKRVGERGEGKWQRMSWQEALDTIADRFTEIADKYGSHSVGFVLGGPGSGNVKFGAYTRFASLFQGTRVSAWGYGDSAGPCAATAMFGAHAPGAFISAFREPKLNICWGTNPAESTPFMMRPLLAYKQGGTRLVVVDPVFTVTASKADEYVRVRPGTDAALALGMMNVIMQEGLQDEDFVRTNTVGPFLVRSSSGRFLRESDITPGGVERYMVWDATTNQPRSVDEAGVSAVLTGTYHVGGIECRPAFQLLADLIAEYPPEKASEVTNVPVDTIRKLALAYATNKPANIYTNNGLGRHYHGDLTFRAVCTLAAITGNIIVPGAAGHRRLVLNWDAFLQPDAERSYSRMGILNTYPSILTEKPYPLKALWFAFTNFVNQCADSYKIINELFPRLDFIVDTALFMNDTAKYADIVLPVCTFLEFSDMVGGPAPYLQLQQKVIEPLYESRSDITILSDLAKRLGFGEYFDKTEEGFVDLLLDSGHPSVEGIDVAGLREGPARINPVPVLPGTQLTQGQFRTASGKVEFYVERLKPLGEELPLYKEPLESGRSEKAEKYPLVFVQVHSRFRHHSSFANIPWLLEINPRPVMDISPQDAASRGITEGDAVVVYNDRGRIKLEAKINEGIQPGVVNIPQGWWFDQFGEGGHNTLSHDAINPAQDAIYEPNMAFNDVLVQVEKA